MFERMVVCQLPSVARRRRPGSPRRGSSFLFPAALAVGLSIPMPVLATSDPPHLRPGLWEARASSSSRPYGSPQVTRMCIGEQTQTRVLQQVGLAMLRICSRHESGMHAGRFVTNSYCTFAGSTIEGRTETTFYRDTAYHTEVVGRVMPSGQTVPSQRTMIDARHVGGCPAGMKPGDIALPNGQRLNLLQLASTFAQ